MGRSMERERHFQRQGLAEKRAAHLQCYSADEVTVARVVGQYPPRDYARERINAHVRPD
jgi:hypothetical protein